MMQGVLGDSRTTGVGDNAPLFKRRCRHTTLHRFAKLDVFHLKHIVDIANRLMLRRSRRIVLEEEIIRLKGVANASRNDIENDKIAPSRITHHAGVRPQPPDGMVFDRCTFDGIGGVCRLARFRHVA